MLTLVAAVEAYDTALDICDRASPDVMVLEETGRSRYVRSLTSVENDMLVAKGEPGRLWLYALLLFLR